MTFLAVKLTPVEESEVCGECDISFVGDKIKHKYLTCTSEAARENNLKELFSKIKMKDAGRKKMDRLMLAIFNKKDEEDSSFTEKLLQQSREKQEVPGLTRKSRRLSGNLVPPQRRSKEENIEKMIQDLYCPQCHRTYKDQAQAKDEKENKHHFCYIIGNLKTSLQIDLSPTPTKKAKLCCTFCPQLKNIVFSNPREMMKHLVLAHKTKFFIDAIKKQNENKGLPKDDYTLHPTPYTLHPGMDKKDLLRIEIFKKRQKEDSSLMEMLLQSRKSRKSRRLSEKIEASSVSDLQSSFRPIQ